MKRPSHIWWCRYSSMMETHPPELSELVRSPKGCLYYFSGICKHPLNLKPDDRPCDVKKYRLVPESVYREKIWQPTGYPEPNKDKERGR